MWLVYLRRCTTRSTVSTSLTVAMFWDMIWDALSACTREGKEEKERKRKKKEGEEGEVEVCVCKHVRGSVRGGGGWGVGDRWEGVGR